MLQFCLLLLLAAPPEPVSLEAQMARFETRFAEWMRIQRANYRSPVVDVRRMRQEIELFEEVRREFEALKKATAGRQVAPKP